MTKERIASAPGKVVLSGEYAVLDGAPAICMAINRRARVSLSTIDGDRSQVTAPGYTETVGRFQSTRDGPVWHGGRQEFALVDSVLRAADVAHLDASAIVLDTSQFIDEHARAKVGIGSSAALTVALCVAIEQTSEVAAIAQCAHMDFQGGAGSGVDIACSVNGGLIEYRVEGAIPKALKWPEGLQFRLLWTGVAANTRARLTKLDAVVSKPSRAGLSDAAADMADAWRSGEADTVVTRYQNYIEQLRSFSVDHELGIFDAGHDELSIAARAANLVYKPCGAGGGDIGIVLGVDAAALDAFVIDHAAKASLLDCEIDYDGGKLEDN